jgi:hypothetical protein
VEDPSADVGLRTYSLPSEHREALLEPTSLFHAAFMPRYVVSVGDAMPHLLDPFRTGSGVPWERYGQDMR